MNLIYSIMLASAAIANAITPNFNSCIDEKLDVEAWDNCEGACNVFSCQTECNREGVMVAEFNGPFLNTCECKCYLP
jgi:hypothetical protein